MEYWKNSATYFADPFSESLWTFDLSFSCSADMLTMLRIQDFMNARRRPFPQKIEVDFRLPQRPRTECSALQSFK